MALSTCAQEIISMTQSESTLMPSESSIVFKEQRYLSYYDEKYFYAWLESIEGIVKVTGIEAGNLRIDLSSPYLTRTGAFDLIALLTRYSYPLSPIRDHIAPEDLGYFQRPEAPWYEKLFGSEEDITSL